MTTLLPLILTAYGAGAPVGQVPHFNVAPTCRADLSSNHACRRDEQEARAKLQKQWLSFSRGERTSCVQLSRLGGDPSYVELLTCLQTERDAAALPKSDMLSGRVTRQ